MTRQGQGHDSQLLHASAASAEIRDGAVPAAAAGGGGDPYLRARLLAASRSNAGALLHAAGRASEAMEEYQASIGIRRRALRAEEGRQQPRESSSSRVGSGGERDDDVAGSTHRTALERERALLARHFGPAATVHRAYGELSFNRSVDLYRRAASDRAMDDDERREPKPFCDLSVSPPLLLDRADILAAAESSSVADDDDENTGCVDSAGTLLNMALWHADRASEASTLEAHRSESDRAVRFLRMALSLLPDHESVVAASASSGSGGRFHEHHHERAMRVAESCVSAGTYHDYVAGLSIQSKEGRGQWEGGFAHAQAQARAEGRAYVAAPNAGAQEQDPGHGNSDDSPPSIYWTIVSTIHSSLGKILLASDPTSSEALSHLARAWIVARLSLSYCPPAAASAAAGDASGHGSLVLSTLSDLGHAHYRRNELGHAMSACRASLHLLRPLPLDARPVTGRKRLGTSRILHNIATLHYVCGQTVPALGQYAAFLGLHGPGDDLRARTLHRMGRIYLSAGDGMRAVGPLTEAAELTSRLRSSSSGGVRDIGTGTSTTEEEDREDEDFSGHHHDPILVSILDDLGSAHLESNSPNDALQAFRRALSIVGDTSGPRSIDATAQLCNVGNVYFLSGYYGEAVKCFRDALDIIEDLCPMLDDEEMDEVDDDGNIVLPSTQSGELAPEEALTFQIQLLNHLASAQLESGNAEAALLSFQEAEEQEQRALRLRSSQAGHVRAARQQAILRPAVEQTRRGAAMARARLPLATSVNILALMGLETGGVGGVEDSNQTAPAA